jgi:hypothetical protein
MAASLRRCTRAVNRSDSAFQKLVVLHALVWAISLLLVSRPSAAPHGGPAMEPNGAQFPNPAGASRTISTSGQVALTGPFFETIGTNGRACVTCHQPGDGMSISAASVQERFDRTAGMDPIFRVVDGSNCNDGVDVSTLAGRRAAYTLLRTRGLIRVAVGVPTNADFTVTNVENPYGCGDTQSISQYRRPLPATNLRFLSAVMWDGRESFGPGRRITFASSREGTLIQDLLAQSFDATTGHAEGAGIRPTAAERRQIVDFELSLYTAQSTVQRGGALGSAGAMGGPVPLAAERFFISINSSVQSLFNLFGLDIGPEFPGGLTEPADSTATTGDGQFTTDVFHLYDAWLSLPSSSPRAAIARGERLFNSAPMTIAGVAGFNDDAANGGLVAGGVPQVVGTCGTCHDTPNVGNHSFPTPLNIGVGDFDPSDSTRNSGGLDISYLPRITACRKDSASTCAVTTDLGQALITGKFDDIGKMKGPVLRGLAARAPYFHNGSAKTLLDVVRFYEKKFNMTLTGSDEADLVAFLSAL